MLLNLLKNKNNPSSFTSASEMEKSEKWQNSGWAVKPGERHFIFFLKRLLNKKQTNKTKRKRKQKQTNTKM